MGESNIKAVIIEDEEKNVELLTSLIKLYFEDITISGNSNSIEKSVELIKSTKPDIVFMDVELRDGISFEVLSQLNIRAFEIIFITAFDHYAIKAFKYAAIDFLLKPVNPAEFITAVNNAMNHRNKLKAGEQFEILLKSIYEPRNNRRIALPTSDGLEFINLNDIISLEADGSYTYFHLAGNKRIVVSRTLREFEDLLDEAPFP